MKITKSSILLLFLILFATITTAFNGFSGFTKLYTFPNQTYSIDGLGSTNEDSTYFINNAKQFYKTNYSFIKSSVNYSDGIIQGNYIYASAGNTFYLGQFLTSTGARTNLSAILFGGGGAVSQYQYYMSNYNKIYNGLYPVMTGYNNRNGFFSLVYTANMTIKCSVAIPSYEEVYMLGSDNDYIYTYQTIQSSSANQYVVYDYDCLIERTGNFTALLTGGLGGVNPKAISNVFYDEPNGYFYGTYGSDSLISWDINGYLGNRTNLSTNGITAKTGVVYGTARIKKGVFNNNTQQYNTLFYNGSNLSDIYLSEYNVQDGQFINQTLYHLPDYLNTGGVDYYDFTNPNIILSNNNVYFQLFDTISSNYDFYIKNETPINIYSGLILYNGSYYDASKTCFDGYFFSSLDGNFLCNNSGLSGNTIYCLNSSNLGLCSGGCTYTNQVNIYGIPYKQGLCSSSACTNECNILGQLTSPTINSVLECGFFDSSGCLSYQQTYCSANEYSQNGVCNVLNYTQRPISKINFDVLPYTSINIKGGLFGCPDINCTYNKGVWNCPEDTCNKYEAQNKNLYKVNYDKVNSILDVKTRTDLGGSGIFTLDLNVQGGNASDVIGVDCDYKSIITPDTIVKGETTASLQTRNINTTETFQATQNPLAFINKNTIVLATNSQSVEVLINSSDSRQLSSLWINLNMTTNEIVVKRENATGNLLFTDVFTTTNGVRKIVLETYFDSINLEQNTMITLLDVAEKVVMNKGVVMQQFDDTNAIAPFSIIITPVLNVHLFSITRETYNSYPLSYATIYTEGVKDFITQYEGVGCSYLQDGTYKARVYLSEEFLGQFFSYKDITIIKETTTPSDLDTTPSNQSIFDGLSKQTKLLMAFIISFILGVIILIIGLIQHNEQEGNFLKYFGIFVFFASLIVFTIIGWLPVWIVIVGILISALTIGTIFISKASGG